jgi:DNA helicase HerA-like ATPase
VQDVSGTAVSVSLVSESATGLSFFNGESYRIGQVGSFVRIPLGYTSLFGIVTQVGAGAAPKADYDTLPWGNQWLKVQLVGERGREGKFERGVSQHPTINDAVHIVTEEDLREIYGPGDPVDFVTVGHLASAESIPALVNINKLVTRHAAVLGTTGAGKSTTVAGLLAALSDPAKYPSARIVILDIHGEYAKALVDRSMVFRIAADARKGEKPLYIPFWALSFDELRKLAFGDLTDQALAAVADAIVALKRESLRKQARDGVTAGRVTVNSPVPFCIHKLWFDFHQREHRTVIPNPGVAADEVESAYVLGLDSKPAQLGDAMSVTPPQYRTVKTTGPADERVQWGPDSLGMRQQLAVLASKLTDPQLAFLFNPDEWRPSPDGTVVKDLDDLLAGWLGSPAPIAILDLSGIPSTVLNDLIGALLRILYDALFWARNIPEGGRERPLMLVLEEAHAYLAKEHSGSAASAVRRIAKEGRKYGVGVMIVSQRPSEIDPTILSQCGTIFAMRLTNDTDRGQIAGAASDNLKGLFDMLPILRTGEAIIVGEAVSLPIRTLIDPPDKGRRPDSSDPRVVVRMVPTIPNDPKKNGYEAEGGWATPRHAEDYAIIMRQWRQQSPHYEHKKNGPHKPDITPIKGET